MHRVRAALPEDAPQLDRVFRRSFPPSAASFPSAVIECWLRRHDRAFWSEAVRTSATTLVATRGNDRVVGFAVGLEREDGRGELDRLFVDPDAWGRGVGSTLHEHILDCLPEEALLWVLVGNQSARHFYEGRGWRRSGATKRVDCDSSGALRWEEMIRQRT